MRAELSLETIRARVVTATVDVLPEQDLGRPQAAVMMALRRDRRSGEVRMLYTERSAHMNAHGGEVCFPGGKREAQDATSWQTALRECHEEIEVQSSAFDCVRSLPHAVSRYGLLVRPWLAVLDPVAEPQAISSETAAVFEVPLRHFADGHTLSYDRFTRDGATYEMPRWRYKDWEIWGLTAMFTATFLRLVLGTGVVRENTQWWKLPVREGAA